MSSGTEYELSLSDATKTDIKDILIIRRLEFNVFPYIGARPIKAITAPELLAVLRRVEARRK